MMQQRGAGVDLKGANILITGGGGNGVASGICQALSQSGARLIINEPTEEKLDVVMKRYPDAVPARADIGKPEEVRAMFDRLAKEIGLIRGLVNNAGIGLSKPFYEVEEQEFDNLYAVDVKGLWLMAKFFTNQLLKNQVTGNIVNVSSVHARSTIARYAIYAGAKAAVEGLTRGMAVDLGKYNIRVNAIAPGYVHAEQNYALISTWTDDPHGWVRHYIENEQVIPHLIDPLDCGNVVAFLLSDRSKSVTGQTIYVDNGDTIKLTGFMPA